MEIQVCGHNMSQTASWTCFILLPKQKSIPLALAMDWDFLSRSPKGEKVMLIMRSWWMSSAKTQTFCQAAFRASNTKTNMTNGIQLLTAAVFFTFKCASFSLKMQHLKWYEWARCGSWRLQVAVLDTKRFGQSLNEKPDPQLQGKREWILERAPVNAGPSPWTALGRCVGQHVLCAFGTAAAKRICGVLTQVMFMCCFSSSLTLGMPLARSRRPFLGTGTCGHSQLKVSKKAHIWHIWSLQRLAWLSRLSTLSELYTPQKQVWDLTSWKHDTTCEASICLVNC